MQTLVVYPSFDTLGHRQVTDEAAECLGLTYLNPRFGHCNGEAVYLFP
jgi:hypothetical protein